MTFDSLAFSVFLPIVLLIYYHFNHRRQNIFLLVASYVFYGWWDWRFLSLLAISTVVDYYAALNIERTGNVARQRWLLFSIMSNLTILGFFKYCNFFVGSFASLLTTMGIPVEYRTLHIVLPVGISFYTFQTMSYTIDVYRGQLRACKNFIDFALYVSYFPQLVAGPIERATRLLPQIESPRRVQLQDWWEGGWLIFWGLFKKVAVSNALAPTVDAVFIDPAQCHWWSLLWGVYFFAVQIYCDFSGYSDIARGTSRLLGIHLMRNFWHPYFATSFREFWHRWHISLSEWLRDYLYIPLGGNKGGRWQTARNLLLTMTLGGLWHGAAWHFVVWGLWHGTLLGLERVWTKKQPSVPRPRWQRLALTVLVFHGVLISWLLFRCSSWNHVVLYVVGLAGGQGGEEWVTWFELARFVVLAGLIGAVDWWEERVASEYAALEWPWPVRGLAWGMTAVIFVALGGLHVNAPFIYFQF